MAIRQPENLKIRQIPQLRRDYTRLEGVVREIEHPKGTNVPDSRRNVAADEIENDGEGLELLKAAERGGNFAGKVVSRQVQVAEVGEIRNGGRERTSEEILAEVDVLEIGTGSDIGWKGGIEGIIEEGNVKEIFKHTELRRKRASDTSAWEIDGNNRVIAVAEDAAP